jgi:hypothetical protein
MTVFLIYHQTKKKWLDRELPEAQKKGNIQRYLNVIGSKEYLMNYVKKKSNSMVEILIAIKKTNQIRYEMYCWPFIAEQLLDSEYWRNVLSLVELGIVDKKIFGIMADYPDSFYQNMGVVPAEQILRYVTMPYLKNEFLKNGKDK